MGLASNTSWPHHGNGAALLGTKTRNCCAIVVFAAATSASLIVCTADDKADGACGDLSILMLKMQVILLTMALTMVWLRAMLMRPMRMRRWIRITSQNYVSATYAFASYNIGNDEPDNYDD